MYDRVLEAKPPADDPIQRLTAALRGVFDISAVRTGALGVEFAGQLQLDPDEAYPVLRDRFAALGYTALLAKEGQLHIVRAVEGVVRPQAGRTWINLVLFLLTVASTLFTGALYEGVNPLQDPLGMWRGIPFAFTVVVILGTHEMGHYIVARRHKADVSLPYFIPLPLTLFGTLGAVIVQRSPFEDRKSLFDVGVAGPLAGLVVAIPLLAIGLLTSQVQPYAIGDSTFFEGNSLFYLGMKRLLLGRLLPAQGLDVSLSPVAFAAWFGLLVTFVNLLPIGQLDGGHVLYALIGRRAWPIASLASQLLLAAGALGTAGALGHVPVLAENFWPGWLVWGLLATWMRPQHPPPLNDLSRLGAGRKALGWLVVVLFFLLFTRMPFSSVPVLF